ncbi:Single-stranded DNA-binding protein, mitochondrial, partial [Armadillidium nasatum]
MSMNMFKKLLQTPVIFLSKQNHFLRMSSDAAATQTRQTSNIEKSLNQVTLLGRSGNNPEQRGVAENPVVTFSLATNINYSKGTEIMQHTEWHRISVFRPHLREKVINYLEKGDRVLVTGRISYLERKDTGNPDIINKNANS